MRILPYSILMSFLLCLGLAACESSTEPEVQDEHNLDIPGWALIWNDEFDADSIDLARWIVADGHWSHNGELQYYAPDEVYVEDGKLRLRSRVRYYEGQLFTSGHVHSNYSFQYGRVDIRAKLPATRGMWPALWMLPANGGWPPEIDILELLGHEPTTIHMSVHWGPLPEGVSPWDIGQTATSGFTGPDFTADYHVFSLEWTTDTLRFLIDDTERFVTTAGVPHEPMYLIMNTAIGGHWPGSPDETTVWPQFHDIDYVRIYETAQ